MSCDKRCYDETSQYHGHEDCGICPGRDDGHKRTPESHREVRFSKEEVESRQADCVCTACKEQSFPYIYKG